jgi:hypothetical protein
VGAGAEGNQRFGLLPQKLSHVLLLRVSDGPVKEGDVNVLVRHRFDILVLDIKGYGPEHDVGYLYYIKDFLVYV